MIYSNVHLTPEVRELEWGNLIHFALGMYGKDTRMMSLPTNRGCVVQEGFNPELTVTWTRSGKPRISNKVIPAHRKKKFPMYMLLSAQGEAPVCSTTGKVGVLRKHQKNVKVLARGTSYDLKKGTGEPIYWDCVLLEVKGPATLVMYKSGVPDSAGAQVYYIDNTVTTEMVEHPEDADWVVI